MIVYGSLTKPPKNAPWREWPGVGNDAARTEVQNSALTRALAVAGGAYAGKIGRLFRHSLFVPQAEPDIRQGSARVV
jgi:hypothetical protein